jgi:drug/metabolite transporter (DMT)-like permease
LGAGFNLVSKKKTRPQGQCGFGLAWIYLVLFGSVIAFTSYMRILQLLPFRIVMTYAYVNPVIAVLLGWLILGEEVTSWTMAGTVLVVAGVAGIFNNRD